MDHALDLLTAAVRELGVRGVRIEEVTDLNDLSIASYM